MPVGMVETGKFEGVLGELEVRRHHAVGVHLEADVPPSHYRLFGRHALAVEIPGTPDFNHSEVEFNVFIQQSVDRYGGPVRGILGIGYGHEGIVFKELVDLDLALISHVLDVDFSLLELLP